MKHIKTIEYKMGQGFVQKTVDYLKENNCENVLIITFPILKEFWIRETEGTDYTIVSKYKIYDLTKFDYIVFANEKKHEIVDGFVIEFIEIYENKQ